MNIIDHGLDKWMIRFKAKTILIAVIVSSFVIFCFYAKFKEKEVASINAKQGKK